MTQDEWLAKHPNADSVLFDVGRRFGPRRVRLFAAECCRRVAHLLTDERSLRGVEFMDGLADRGHAGRIGRPKAEKEAKAAALQARSLCGARGTAAGYARAAAFSAAECVSCALSVYPEWGAHNAIWDAARALVHAARAGQADDSLAPLPAQQRVNEEERQLRRLLYDLSVVPVVELDPSWLARNDGAARKVAQALYDERAFDRTPILADALEDAGCGEAAILEHLRSPGPHLRGCWAVDLVLGKG